MDGGFFERFGSLLQQAENKHEEVVLAAMPLNEALPEHLDDGGDSGVEIAADSDSEQDSEQLKADKSVDFIEDVVGWNVSTNTLFFFIIKIMFFKIRIYE